MSPAEPPVTLSRVSATLMHTSDTQRVAMVRNPSRRGKTGSGTKKAGRTAAKCGSPGLASRGKGYWVPMSMPNSPGWLLLELSSL